jgi:hypothetical protein
MSWQPEYLSLNISAVSNDPDKAIVGRLGKVYLNCPL